jgi:hypothetical protein
MALLPVDSPGLAMRVGSSPFLDWPRILVASRVDPACGTAKAELVFDNASARQASSAIQPLVMMACRSIKAHPSAPSLMQGLTDLSQRGGPWVLPRPVPAAGTARPRRKIVCKFLILGFESTQLRVENGPKTP